MSNTRANSNSKQSSFEASVTAKLIIYLMEQSHQQAQEQKRLKAFQVDLQSQIDELQQENEHIKNKYRNLKKSVKKNHKKLVKAHMSLMKKVVDSHAEFNYHCIYTENKIKDMEEYLVNLRDELFQVGQKKEDETEEDSSMYETDTDSDSDKDTSSDYVPEDDEDTETEDEEDDNL